MTPDSEGPITAQPAPSGANATESTAIPLGAPGETTGLTADPAASSQYGGVP